MNRVRMNVYVEHAHVQRITALAIKRKVSRSSIVATALADFFSGDIEAKRQEALLGRLDKLSKQFDSLDVSQNILIEGLALFVRHQLAVAASIPEAHKPLVRAQARARFTQYVSQLVAHLQSGGSLVQRVIDEMAEAGSRRRESASTSRGETIE